MPWTNANAARGRRPNEDDDLSDAPVYWGTSARQITGLNWVSAQGDAVVPFFSPNITCPDDETISFQFRQWKTHGERLLWVLDLASTVDGEEPIVEVDFSPTLATTGITRVVARSADSTPGGYIQILHDEDTRDTAAGLQINIRAVSGTDVVLRSLGCYEVPRAEVVSRSVDASEYGTPDTGVFLPDRPIIAQHYDQAALGLAGTRLHSRNLFSWAVPTLTDFVDSNFYAWRGSVLGPQMFGADGIPVLARPALGAATASVRVSIRAEVSTGTTGATIEVAPSVATAPPTQSITLDTPLWYDFDVTVNAADLTHADGLAGGVQDFINVNGEPGDGEIYIHSVCAYQFGSPFSGAAR